MAPEVKQWKDTALFLLRAAGWRPFPAGQYVVSVEYRLTCARNRDVDSVAKVLIDLAVGEALGIDDKQVSSLVAVKRSEPSRAKHGVAITVRVLEHPEIQV